MRLWSVHPMYLDSKGLVALWREGLLAQKVLQGKTKGYKNHPQLNRFKEQQNPEEAIAVYLHEVCNEADKRLYRFDRTKLPSVKKKISTIPVTKGQFAFEMKHLCQKLQKRDIVHFKKMQSLTKNCPHPLFVLTPGKVADWEKI